MKLSKRCSKFLKLFILVCVCGSIIFGFILMKKAHDLQGFTDYRKNSSFLHYPESLHLKHPRNIVPVLIQHSKTVTTISTKTFLNQSKIKETFAETKFQNSKKSEQKSSLKMNFTKELVQLQETTGPPSYTVHAFYYPWYGSPEHDGQFLHWNHPYIRHWNKVEAQKWPNYTHIPPDDVGSNFYPLLGAYSSRDIEVINYHMQMMKYARIGKNCFFKSL